MGYEEAIEKINNAHLYTEGEYNEAVTAVREAFSKAEALMELEDDRQITGKEW